MGVRKLAMNRLKDFKLWYRHLRKEGKRMYGDNQVDIAWYAKYNVINCALWAWYNSKHNTLDGKYK
jgi:hypothetical protein